MSLDPIKSALWGVLVGNIETMGILPALEGGQAVARCLEGSDVLEKLAQVDGDDNYEIVEKDGFRYVILKHCPFAAIYKDIPAWGERATKLVEAYNRKEDGGGALHPLCLVHKGSRTAMRAGVVSLGCRSEGTGKIEVAEKALPKASISKEEVLQLLDGKACLFAIKAD
jgi:hypothetical protein